MKIESSQAPRYHCTPCRRPPPAPHRAPARTVPAAAAALSWSRLQSLHV